MCERKKLKMNAAKSEMMSHFRHGGLRGAEMFLNSETLQEVVELHYLNVNITSKGIMETNVSNQMGKRAKIMQA